jgi:hypothetical protein
VIVRLVDIGGIFDHHCLFLPFIIIVVKLDSMDIEH